MEKTKYPADYASLAYTCIHYSASYASDIFLFNHSQTGRECYNLAMVCNAVFLNIYKN